MLRKIFKLHKLTPSKAGMRLAIAFVLICAGAIISGGMGSADGSGLPKVVIISGPVSECGGTVHSLTPRTMSIYLHARPTGHVVATYIVKPSTHLSFYAFAVTSGTYFLTTNQAFSSPPRGNIVISTKSKSIVTETISTVCQ